MTITAVQWLVLDNLNNGWSYRTNLDWDLADAAYLWAVHNEYIKDRALTVAGMTVLLLSRGIRRQMVTEEI